MLLIARRTSLLANSIVLVTGYTFGKASSPEVGRGTPAFRG